MPDLVLHSFRRCPFAIRARLALEEKGLSYVRIEEDLSALSTRLLELHPEGRVPLLIHEGVAIPESAVITEYLDERFPAVPLRPATAMGRAQTRLWTHWCDQRLKPDLDAFKYDWVDLTPAARETLVGRLRGHLAKLEASLSRGGYLMDGEFTLADIHVFPFYRQLQRSRAEFQAYFQPKVADDWLARIIARPSFERAMRKN